MKKILFWLVVAVTFVLTLALEVFLNAKVIEISCQHWVKCERK